MAPALCKSCIFFLLLRALMTSFRCTRHSYEWTANDWLMQDLYNVHNWLLVLGARSAFESRFFKHVFVVHSCAPCR